MGIHFRRAGGGEPLVLIHGIGHRHQAWDPVFDRLAAHHEVIALDLPGFGQSPVPDAGMPADMAATVAAILPVLTEWRLERPHVAGYSLGGAISLELAAAGTVASATAFSPAGFFTPAERRRALAILRMLRANAYLPTPIMRVALRSAYLRAMCFAPLMTRPALLDAERALGDALALRRGLGFTSVARAARDYRFDGARLSGTTVPVTIGWGDCDRIFRVHQAERARADLPAVRVVTLPGCGHVPMSDDPDLVASLILETTGALSRTVRPGHSTVSSECGLSKSRKARHRGEPRRPGLTSGGPDRSR
ncbi:alpha/beta fold hydrolase [Micromonospora inositola]|uniref:Pimeloyl-ACP methyl ester carboxylesterase n=1 Tax=Micromonospora inositola TaxID=47865 RepID=A0A1C5JRS8_9ACTN|nr:alpha/beta fold hydrolase [Micromonospora inositola]SCG73021.1 Pimeloyl-ACP methyl ester carboxylesterase [Micromonospora inositola]